MILLMFLLACGEEEGEDPAEHACEHVGEAGTAVTAAEAMEDAPELDVSEEPYTVTLVDGAAGFVGVHAHEDEEVLLFTDTADVILALYHDGAEETLPAPSPVEGCEADLPEHFHLDLHEGEWTLELGPAAVESVWLMLLASGDHEHEDH
jgi:hypothetical protein